MKWLLFWINIFSASVAYAVLVSQPIPVDYNAADSEITAPKSGTNQPIAPLNSVIKNVSSQQFFQNFQTCTGPVGLEIPAMTGTIYGINNRICHFNLKIKASFENIESQSVVCYVPIETFLAAVAVTDAEVISSPSDEAAMLVQENQNELSSPELQEPLASMLNDPQASAFFNSLNKLKPYCVIQKSSKQFEDLQQQFQSNVTPTEVPI